MTVVISIVVAAMATGIFVNIREDV